MAANRRFKTKAQLDAGMMLPAGAVAGNVLTSDGSGNGTWQAVATSGAAGGDLTGTYPNPQIGAGVVVNADVNASAAIALSKLANARAFAMAVS